MSQSLPSEEVPTFQSRLSTRLVDDIVPYWRNPRRITDEAVNAVAESIRQYGYQQPIVVDEKSVIIIGHTRYAALRRMGVKEVQVLTAVGLDPRKVKQLRTIDNRTSEFAIWDFEKLVSELGDLDSELMRSFFPEIAPAVEDLTQEDAPDGELTGSAADRDAAAAVEHDNAQDVEFVCPSCFNMWTTTVSREELLAGKVGG